MHFILPLPLMFLFMFGGCENTYDLDYNPDGEKDYAVVTCTVTGNEVCDGVDNDCDGYTDEGDAEDVQTWYKDADGDGHSVEDEPIIGCSPPYGYTDLADDCDDTDASVYPGAFEYCDLQDNDCDGMWEMDDPDAADIVYFWDHDGDGYGSDNGGCSVYGEMPTGYARTNDDCDDTDASVYPGNGC